MDPSRKPALPAAADTGAEAAAKAPGALPPQSEVARTSTPAADPDAAGGFTVLPSLQRIASGPVCENGVCYIPGAAPDGEQAVKK